jgi:hypothetical protein
MPAVQQPNIDKLLLCARLADYCYTSGKPGVNADELSAKCPPGYHMSENKNFFSHSWNQKPENQHRFFKSHAYVCRLTKKEGPGDKNQIVVGFRGTWLHAGTSEHDSDEGTRQASKLVLILLTRHTAPKRTAKSGMLSKLSNLSFNIIGPSNYGLADLYYDATLIRVPYRKGVVWKWFTYWGSLVLGGSNWMRNYFVWPREVAGGLISRPYPDAISDRRNGLVHLGFWALWASPEGFAGYNRDGHLWTNQIVNGDAEAPESPREPVREGVLQTVLKMVEEGDQSRETEILVVGHSLGGAVSW